MTHSVLSHGSFAVERRFAASPSRVFRAWADPVQLQAWAAPAEGWSFAVERFEFQPGGVSVCRFGPDGEEPFLDVGRYDDIIPDRRILSAYAISRADMRISSSVSSYDFLADGTGTLLRITELGFYQDGQDLAPGRQGGVTQQLAQLGRFLDQS